MNVIMILFLVIALNFGRCLTNRPSSSSSESILSEENCSAEGTFSDTEFWAWTRQQNELFDNDEKENGIVCQFLEDLEQEEQHAMFPPPVIHPIAAKYTHKTVEQEIKIIEKAGEKEKFENLMQILRNDANLLKRVTFLGGQCAVKVSSLFSSIRPRLDLAFDLVASQFGIDTIVPTKIPLSNGKILKILAIKWMKMRKLKNEQKNGPNGNGKKRKKKQKKYVEELLKLLKGLFDGPQFELLSNNGNADKKTGSSRHRRRRRSVNIWVYIFGVIAAVCLLVFCVKMLENIIGKQAAKKNHKTFIKKMRHYNI